MQLNGHDDEVAELLGAYALDALEPFEVVLVEEHLESCPRCRAELLEHREVAGLLSFAGQEAPTGLWDRVVSSMQETPPPMRLPRAMPSIGGPGGSPIGGMAGITPISELRARRGLRVRVAALAAAAAAVAAVAGIGIGHLDRHTTPAGTSLAAVHQALATPGSRKVVLAATKGTVGSLDAVVLPDGQGYLYDDKLSPLASDRTYQLWGIVGLKHVSYGVLGASPDRVEAFQAVSGVQVLAVTEEVAGGVLVTHQAPVVVGAVPALPTGKNVSI